MAKQQINHYHWDNAATLVRGVEVREQDNGRAVAYIEADNRPEMAAARQSLRALLRLKGWGTLSDHRDGKFVLRVTGLDDGAALMEVLHAEGLVPSAPAQVTSTAPQAEKATSIVGYIRNHSLRISGIIATIGNVMSIASGIHRGKEIGQIGQGVAFSLADLPLAIAGERDDSRQLADLLRQLTKHYHKEGIEIPKNASILVETSNQGKSAGELAMDYLHRYANQIKCSLEVVAAFFTYKAGIEQKSRDKKFAASIFGPGFLASLLIPEKKIDPEKYAQAGTLQRAWMRVQEHPLMIGGLLGYSNTFFTYKSAINERRESLAPGGNGRRLYRWDFAIPTVMIGANGTYAISKKAVGGDIREGDMVSDVYSIVAQILNKQPPELQRKTLESTARFLAERTEIRDDYAQIVARLHAEVQIQRQNPWFEKQGLPDYTPEPRPHGRAAAPDVATTPLPHASAIPATTIATRELHSAPLKAPEAALGHA